jgi:hypothetical protein
MVFVAVEPKTVVDVYLVVAMAEWGRGGGIDDSIRSAQHFVEPADGNCLGNCRAVNDDPIMLDSCLNHERLPPIDVLDCVTPVSKSAFPHPASSRAGLFPTVMDQPSDQSNRIRRASTTTSASRSTRRTLVTSHARSHQSWLAIRS